MSEYDYSGLYNSPQNNGPAGSGQPAASESSTPRQEGGYPNVGSSGMNTANTARTDYSASGSQETAGAQQPASGASFHSYTSPAGGGSGTTPPTGQAPYQNPNPNPAPKRRGGGKKVALRVVAGIGVVVLGFGGGLLGTAAGNALGLGRSQVVVQQVVRDEATTADNQGSTGGSSMSLVDISAAVQPSVVAITTEQMVATNSWFGNYVQSGAGSGVIISQDGYILTCAHVVSGANTITVELSDGSSYSATVVGSDTTSDIAVIKIDATGLSAATLGDSDGLAVGETVVAVGNPMGTLSGTVTDGIVSAVNRAVEVEGNEMNLIQTDAAISPGNSGGGLFNGNGELIGIVNASGSTTTSSGAVSQNLGFAIPINDAMEIANQLIENGYVARPALGVTIVDISTEQQALQYGVSAYGVYIYQVNPGGGADQAGLQQGDRIISIDSNSVSTGTDLTSYLETKQVGDTVELQIERDGRMATYTVTLGESTANTNTSENAIG